MGDLKLTPSEAGDLFEDLQTDKNEIQKAINSLQSIANDYPGAVQNKINAAIGKLEETQVEMSDLMKKCKDIFDK